MLALAALVIVLGSNALRGPAQRLGWMQAPAALSPAPTPAAVLTPPSQPLPSPNTAPTASSQTPINVSTPAQKIPVQNIHSDAARKAPPEPFLAEPAAPIREMGEDLAQLAFEARLPFLDARRSGEYTEGHIAGAWCLPVWESDLDARITLFEARVRSGNRDPLVIYCSGGDCEDSRILASKLMGLGYRNLWIYHGGYPEWTQAGRPVRKGDRP